MDIALSVVSGTYNRLDHMRRMVASIRQSIGTGIPYEIVLIDGGSADGTIEWCKAQPDIVLIEQGELLGAIKAFNEGAYASRGTYVVLGNDDILYLEETLPTALAFMQDNPDVGVGCFYQDRDHPGQWDLSYMPVVMDHKQMQHVYGQVCIVPRWLGDEVGWWGNFPDMRTYGGDNNLSCFILERGYKVTGVPCACISDMKVEDDLRRINNTAEIQRRRPPRGGHPDSNAWGAHWTNRDGTCGPIVKMDGPDVPNPIERKTRFLYLPIYEQGHTIQKSQKRGLREALARYGMVYEMDWLQIAGQYGGTYMINYVRDMIDSWKPDVLLTQIHSPDPKMFNAETVRALRQEYPSLVWVNWNGDYHPEDLLSAGNLEMVKQFDLQCLVTTMVRDPYRDHGVSWMYWQIGYEDSSAQPNGSTPHHDVVFLANGYSRDRIALARVLRESGYNTGIYGSWGAGVTPNGSNLYNFDEGAKLYRAAKVSIGDNQWGDRAVGFVSNRLFQALSAGGALLMHQRVPGLDELLGLKDGEHYVEWSDLSDLKDKLGYWLAPEHESERLEIATKGRDFVRERHSFDARVQELMEIVSLWLS
jgi:hypothetical protein